MKVELILQALREIFPAQSIEARPVPTGDTFVALAPDCIHAAARRLRECFDLRHLSAITGLDTGGEIELLYHFWEGEGLTLRTSLPREEPHIVTLTDLIPGAAFYEREVREMLGVTFDGHPDLCPLLLPEDWEGEPPLRQQHSPPSPGDREREGTGESEGP